MKINGEVPTGAMIAIRPERAWDIALPKGEEAAALHVTLKYLGDAIEIPYNKRAVVKLLLQRLLRGRQTIDALVTGVERFGEDGDALVLTLEAPELNVLHEDAHTITPWYGLKWPEYKPHMTMMYDKSGTKDFPKEMKELVGQTLRFDCVILCFGTDREHFYLEDERSYFSDMDIVKRSKGRDYTIPSPLSSAKEIRGRHSHRPAGTSVRWPAMYRELRKKGYSKRKAAMISNGKWRKKHGLPTASARGISKSQARSRRLMEEIANIEKDSQKMSLNPEQFRFAGQLDSISKAGTRAGAIKGWVTRRRNAGVSLADIEIEGQKKYGSDWDKYKPNMGRSTRQAAVNAEVLRRRSAGARSVPVRRREQDKKNDADARLASWSRSEAQERNVPWSAVVAAKERLAAQQPKTRSRRAAAARVQLRAAKRKDDGVDIESQPAYAEGMRQMRENAANPQYRRTSAGVGAYSNHNLKLFMKYLSEGKEAPYDADMIERELKIRGVDTSKLPKVPAKKKVGKKPAKTKVQRSKNMPKHFKSMTDAELEDQLAGNLRVQGYLPKSTANNRMISQIQDELKRRKKKV